MSINVFIALRQLWDRKLLNGIAVLGVSLGVLVLIGMNGIMQGFQMKFKGEILRISPHVSMFDKELGNEQTLGQKWLGFLYKALTVAENILHKQPDDRDSQIKFPKNLIKTIESMPEVEAACMGMYGQATLSRGTQEVGVDMRGIEPNKQDRCTPVVSYVTEGSWLVLGANPDGVALGVGVAEKLGAKVGDQVRLSVARGKVQLIKVVAIFDSGVPPIDKQRVYVNIAASQRVLGRFNAINRIEVRLKDPFRSVEVSDRLERMTRYDCESWQEAQANFLSLFDMQNMIVAMVIAAILVVGGFGILAIQIMIVLQKTRDIAILRSVGFRKQDILLIFLIQGIIVSLLGAILGDLLGWRLVEFLGSLQIKQEGLVKSSTFLVYKDPMFYLYGVFFAMITGITASLLPAWRAAKVEPVDVLRGQV